MMVKLWVKINWTLTKKLSLKKNVVEDLPQKKNHQQKIPHSNYLSHILLKLRKNWLPKEILPKFLDASASLVLIVSLTRSSYP